MAAFAKGNFITINGTPITDPKFGSGAFTIATNVSEARNAKGDFVGSTVGNDKYKVELSWEILPADEAKAVFGIFDRSRGGAFVNNISIYDPRINGMRSMRMYVSDRTGTPIMVVNGVARYMKDVRVALIEV